MADNQPHDLEFDVSESMLAPFRGTVQFSVQKKIRILNFEFSTHEMGCRRITGRNARYGVKLTLNGKILFVNHKNQVYVELHKKLILMPGNTYKLQTWVGGHAKPKPDEIVRPCEYHYAEISQCDTTNYEPFEFVFNENEDAEPSNKTCLYVISYEMVD